MLPLWQNSSCSSCSSLQITNQYYYTTYQALQLFCPVMKRWSITLTKNKHNCLLEMEKEMEMIKVFFTISAIRYLLKAPVSNLNCLTMNYPSEALRFVCGSMAIIWHVNIIYCCLCVKTTSMSLFEWWMSNKFQALFS